MFVYYNPNPLGLSVGDCTIRAISCALNISWEQTYTLAQGGNSYMMYDPRYDYSMARGYSRTSKEEALSELQKMMGEVTDEKVKMALQEAITKMNK